jgi:Tfp pilus assembly protein PilZ
MSEDPPLPLSVQYGSRRALLVAAKTERGMVTLFIPTPRTVRQGTRVRLQISLGDVPERFEILGVSVTDGRMFGRGGTGGFLARFEGDDKRRAAEMIAFCAQRPLSMGTASRERVLVRKGCVLKQAEQELPGELRDLSQTGAFVVGRGYTKLKVDEPVLMKVSNGLFGLGAIWLEARVVWQGAKGEERGVGLRFTGLEARQATAIQRLLERALAEQGPKGSGGGSS